MSLLKRIIFCLYYQDGYFYLSRNFRLQRVGNLEWLIKNFGFGETANFIDELIIVSVKKNRNSKDYKEFLDEIYNLKKKIFIPITLGGGINTYKIAKNYFLGGADKVLINTCAYINKKLVEKISLNYGSQAISVMVDFKKKNECL